MCPSDHPRTNETYSYSNRMPSRTITPTASRTAVITIRTRHIRPIQRRKTATRATAHRMQCRKTHLHHRQHLLRPQEKRLKRKLLSQITSL